MNKSTFSFLLIGLLFLVACENASDTVVGIPNVQLVCNSSDDPTCETGSNGNDAFVIMTRSGCGDSADFEPIAQGNVAMVCSSSGCTGTISNWSDSNSNSVTEIISGRMDVCSRFDIGPNDATASSGDLSDESSILIQSSSTITVDSWTTL